MNNREIIIRESGVPKTLNPMRLSTKVGEGSGNWIPEGETGLARITINSNGEYLASNDGYYGYAIVNVCVSGGNEAEISGDPYVDPVTDPDTGEITTPDHEVEDFTGDFLDPELETPVRVTPPPNSKTGTQTGKVIGIDPDTGEYVQVSVDENGNIVTEAAKLPVRISILTPPAKLEYAQGDKIEYAGLKISLHTSDNQTFVNDDFPWGYVTWQPAPDLIFDGNNVITPRETVPYGEIDPSEAIGTLPEYADSGTIEISSLGGSVWAVYGRIMQHVGHDFVDNSYRHAFLERIQYLYDEYPDCAVTGHANTASGAFGDAAFLVLDVFPDLKVGSTETLGNKASNYPRVGVAIGAMGDFSSPNDFTIYTMSIGHNDTGVYSRSTPSLFVGESLAWGIKVSNINAEKYYGVTEVPVKWKSPYDGRTYETSFDISVEG